MGLSESRGLSGSFNAAIAATDVRSLGSRRTVVRRFQGRFKVANTIGWSPASNLFSRRSRSATDVFGLFRVKNRGRLPPSKTFNGADRSSATDDSSTGESHRQPNQESWLSPSIFNFQRRSRFGNGKSGRQSGQEIWASSPAPIKTIDIFYDVVR